MVKSSFRRRLLPYIYLLFMIKKIFLPLFCLFLAVAVQGRDLPESVRKSLDSMIQDGLKQGAFPGASLAVGERSGVLYAQNYGYHSYASVQPVTNQSLFDVASCTKVLSTTFAVMRLYDQGVLVLTEPVRRYLPEWAENPIGGVTLMELLTHTSGMRAQIFHNSLLSNVTGGNLFSGKRSAEYPHQVEANYYVARQVAYDSLFLCKYPRDGWRRGCDSLYVNPAVDTLIIHQIVRDYKPSRRGTCLYSDTNFLILKWIVERVSGKSLEQITQALFEELGCVDTYYNPLRYCDKSRCVPTEIDYILCRDTVQGYVHDELAVLMGGVGGHAGLFTTVSDVARFCEMILNGGSYNGRQILSRATVDLFTSSPYQKTGVLRGLGFNKFSANAGALGGLSSFGHTGFTGTFLWMDARIGIYAVFLSNAPYPTRVNTKLNSSKLRTKIWQTFKQGFN